MDRTSWIAVIICIGLFFFFSWKQQEQTAEYRKKMAEYEAQQEQLAPEDPANTGDGAVKATDGTTPTAEPGTDASPQPAVESADVETIELSNDKVKFVLTNKGAGVSEVHLLDYNRKLNEDGEKVALNQSSIHPIGSLSNGPKQYDQSVWTVKSKTATSVTFETTTPEKLAYEKTFTLPADGQDPYEMNLDVTIKNLTGTQFVTGKNRYLYLGGAQPLSPNEWSMQIGFFFKDGDDFESKTVDHFKGGFIFGKEKPSDTFIAESFDWAGVHGQFFATILKADSPYYANVWASRLPVSVDGEKKAGKNFAAEAAVSMPDLNMAVDGVHLQKYRIFAGPKQGERLKAFGDERQLAMDYDRIPIFGWLFGWAIKPLAGALSWTLHVFHGWGMAWGYAIILITILIRIIIWPVYAKSTRTMKRMSKLTPKMQEIKEKYKDDPQKMNQETMALYGKYGANPLGGCLPMFIQLPVFLSFYRMLWSEPDLRHESFWWVDDLSMPDTQFEIPFPFFGFTSIPVNPLPLLMALTTFIQMQLTPKTGDKTQRMIFMFMPLIFLVICYNFAAALSLYWTTQNIFSIFQTWLMNKLPEPELKAKKKSGFMARLQEQAEAAQRAKKAGAAGSAPSPGSRTKMPGEKGDRHQKGKKKKKK